ncbi:MAG: ATP-binding protein [Daejeonella sp.]|uniref:ATP-binding protein n=1 Tax=Daejeonella sp. TaxID=2805397 RepID=UPI0027363C7E|nr:ATP-binding protein [Daejeonella sp.]MDP3468322.1 ATP-binding protein [Daejeonella sp.]
MKIRLLLFLLAIGFACTALTINYTIQDDEVLSLEARKVERRLHRKEKLVDQLLNNSAIRDSLKNINSNGEWAQFIISEFSEKEDIYIETFENGKLSFWSGIRIVLETDSLLREGITFINWKNGYYEAIKRTWGNFSVICYIPIMADYPYQNEYLRNSFSPDLLSSNTLDIASLNDKEVFNIRNLSGKYLFSVKLRTPVSNSFYSYLEIWMWVLALIFALISLTHLCISIADRGYVGYAVILLFSSVLAFRLIDLQYQWFSQYFDIELFNPKHYASSYFFPSIGDFFLNIICFTWVFVFIYSYRNNILTSFSDLSKPVSYFLLFLTGLFICISAYVIDYLFNGLVTNSNINFDVSNVLNSTWLSWFGFLIFCFAILNLYLIISFSFDLISRLNINAKERLITFIVALLLAIIYHFFTEFSIYYLLFALMLFLAGKAYFNSEGKIKGGTLVVCILIFALIGSLKLSNFQFVKEQESRKILAGKLESSVDPNAILLFYNLEQEIVRDKFVADYFQDPLSSHSALSNRLTKLYMAGYLSRYDFESFEYNEKDEFFQGDRGIPLSNFKNLVLSGSVKVSEYFYQRNNTFGFKQYFAILPIIEDNNKLGTLVLQLNSKRLNEVGVFPELLIDGKIKEDLQLNNYSFAYYSDGRLLNQHGSYVYNLVNTEFRGKNREYIYVNNYDNGRQYNHLVFQPNPRKLVVVSREVNSLFTQLASVSFIFLILLFFSGLIYVLQLLWNSFQNYNISFRNFRWRLLISSNRMLYKTRIQLSMVSAVVITLVLTGIITFLNISQQYRDQQENTVLDKVAKISSGINKQIVSMGMPTPDEQAEVAFNSLADLNGVDLNLFDLNGELLHSTQPKIYENGLIAPRMNALAYLYLNRLQKSEFINREQIGNLSFISAYVPLRNNKSEVIAYLGLPYFSNEKDYQDRIGIFLNALINVYALVFVAIGFFAVFVASRITSPLTLIQKLLRDTKIGAKNEHINWKRNDEIGNLISEYNTMISALDESAQKLARSERESAWREMAKQVAHEIKNPLTPLKLGVQLLEKSWKENDPKFEAKFERFTKSFIEQIESLSHIASEFSNFAKMPETKLEQVNLNEIIEQSIILYRQSENTTINFENTAGRDIIVQADRDQILRCFNNLIKNSIEAKADERNCIINILLYRKSGSVCVEIKDNGTGMHTELERKIFTPNFTTKSSGTGLGLAFVKQAIENIDGNITFDTVPDSGTIFYIELPLIEPQD